jgi:hypothetical protein
VWRRKPDHGFAKSYNIRHNYFLRMKFKPNW